MKDKLIEAIINMKEEEALQLAQDMLGAGEHPQTVLSAGREAMTIIGDRFEKKEYFLPELILGGEIFKEITEMVKPKLKDSSDDAPVLGNVVIGTVAGDIHDVGKDIVAFMLDVNNFKVHDLGVDVKTETFLDKIEEIKPDIVAMSGFLTLAFDAMKDTVSSIKEAGLRDEVKIMIGGAPMDEEVVGYVGADAYRSDASAAVKLAKKWIGGI